MYIILIRKVTVPSALPYKACGTCTANMITLTPGNNQDSTTPVTDRICSNFRIFPTLFRPCPASRPPAMGASTSPLPAPLSTGDRPSCRSSRILAFSSDSDHSLVLIFCLDFFSLHFDQYPFWLLWTLIGLPDFDHFLSLLKIYHFHKRLCSLQFQLYLSSLHQSDQWSLVFHSLAFSFTSILISNLSFLASQILIIFF